MSCSAVTITESVINATASFTRPADTTAYAAGDLVANSTTAGSVVPLEYNRLPRATSQGFSVRRVRMQSNRTSGITAIGTVPANASFRVHLYTELPTVTNGDNGAFFSTQSDAYIGALDVTLNRGFSDGFSGIGLPVTGAEIIGNNMSAIKLYALVQATAAYTPVSGEIFTVILEGYNL